MNTEKDLILEEFFKPERWTAAIKTADLKGINKGTLR